MSFSSLGLWREAEVKCHLSTSWLGDVTSERPAVKLGSTPPRLRSCCADSVPFESTHCLAWYIIGTFPSWSLMLWTKYCPKTRQEALLLKLLTHPSEEFGGSPFLNHSWGPLNSPKMTPCWLTDSFSTGRLRGTLPWQHTPLPKKGRQTLAPWGLGADRHGVSTCVSAP